MIEFMKKKITERRKVGSATDRSSFLDISADHSLPDSRRKSFKSYFRYLLIFALVGTAVTVFYFVDPTHATSLRSVENFVKSAADTTEQDITAALKSISAAHVIEEEAKPLDPVADGVISLENEEAVRWKGKGRRRIADMGDRYEEAEEEVDVNSPADDDDDDGDDENKNLQEEGGEGPERDFEKLIEEEEEGESEENEGKDEAEGLSHQRRKTKKTKSKKFSEKHALIEEVHQQIEKVRQMKDSGTVMEVSEEAKTEIGILQDKLRLLLKSRYGAPPYVVEMRLKFPESMADSGPVEDKIIFELAPIELVPYSVYYFLEVIKNWKGGSFHRNAGHVLQAMVKGNMPGLAFQEYHKDFPHLKYTMGYAGRPGGPAFYISTQNNKWNHGPGSQGSKTEADSCFAVINDEASKAVVDRMTKQPGAGKGSGFIEDSKNFIQIISLLVL